MAYQASHQYARVTARKARLVADLVRGLNASHAIEVLRFNPRRASALFRAVIQSALANAGQEQGVNLNRLVIREIFVNEGPTQKRGRPVARGRWHRILKRTAHLHVVLDEPQAAGDPKGAGGEAVGSGSQAGGRV